MQHSSETPLTIKEEAECGCARHGPRVYSVILNGLIVLQGLPIISFISQSSVDDQGFPRLRRCCTFTSKCFWLQGVGDAFVGIKHAQLRSLLYYYYQIHLIHTSTEI